MNVGMKVKLNMKKLQKSVINMKVFGVDVTYNGTITERTIVIAADKEDAKRKILEDDVDDVIDDFIERDEVIDFDFFSEEEVDE